MNVHTFFMIDRAYWERPGLSVAAASDLSWEGENSRGEEAKIFVIFMQEQVHTVAYALQVNRFQTTVDLKVNNDSRFLCCSYGFRGMSGVLGSWYRRNTLLEVARDPGCLDAGGLLSSFSGWEWYWGLLEWENWVSVVIAPHEQNFRFCKLIPCCHSYDAFHFCRKPSGRRVCMCVGGGGGTSMWELLVSSCWCGFSDSQFRLVKIMYIVISWCNSLYMWNCTKHYKIFRIHEFNEPSASSPFVTISSHGDSRQGPHTSLHVCEPDTSSSWLSSHLLPDLGSPVFLLYPFSLSSCISFNDQRL